MIYICPLTHSTILCGHRLFESNRKLQIPQLMGSVFPSPSHRREHVEKYRSAESAIYRFISLRRRMGASVWYPYIYIGWWGYSKSINRTRDMCVVLGVGGGGWMHTRFTQWGGIRGWGKELLYRTQKVGRKEYKKQISRSIAWTSFQCGQWLWFIYIALYDISLDLHWTPIRI